IKPGDDWDTVIKREIARADIVLMLVSQSFLVSRYVKNVEISRSLRKRDDKELRIFPVLLSPCDWKSKPWLSQLQMIPSDDETAATHYSDFGQRNALFLTIL